MEHGAEEVAQAQISDRQRAIRRILQAVDEAEGDVISVVAQNKALKGILDSDIFYSKKRKRNGTFVEYDLHAMRELAANILRDCKLKSVNGEDRVTQLFRIRSRGLPPKQLRRWQHEPVQVPLESKRNQISQTLVSWRPESESSTRMDGPVIPKDFQGLKKLDFFEKSKLFRYRALWLSLQDIDASRPESNKSGHKYRTYSMRTEALQDLCRRFRLRYLAKTRILQEYSGKSLCEVIRKAWRTFRTDDSIALDSLWLEGSKSFRPEILREIKAAYDAFDDEGNISLTQDAATPDPLEHGRDHAGRGSTSSMTSSDHITVDFRPQPEIHSTEPGPVADAHHAKPRRRLKRKASIAESPLSNGSSLKTVRMRSPVVDLPPRDLVEARATHAPNDLNTIALDKPSRLSPKDVIQHMHSIRDLQITQVQWMLGYFELPHSQSPVTVTPEPNKLLEALYTRCWGDGWRRDGDLLLRQGKRSVFNDTMALISSFLFDNVLTPDAEISQNCSDPSPELWPCEQNFCKQSSTSPSAHSSRRSSNSLERCVPYHSTAKPNHSWAQNSNTSKPLSRKSSPRWRFSSQTWTILTSDLCSYGRKAASLMTGSECRRRTPSIQALPTYIRWCTRRFRAC